MLGIQRVGKAVAPRRIDGWELYKFPYSLPAAKSRYEYYSWHKHNHTMGNSIVIGRNRKNNSSFEAAGSYPVLPFKE